MFPAMLKFERRLITMEIKSSACFVTFLTNLTWKVVIEREEGRHKTFKEDMAEMENTWIGTKEIVKKRTRWKHDLVARCPTDDRRK